MVGSVSGIRKHQGVQFKRPTNLNARSVGSSTVGQENWDAWVDLDGSNNLVTRRVFGNSFDALLARVSSAGDGLVLD